jgi:hypothetical protein
MASNVYTEMKETLPSMTGGTDVDAFVCTSGAKESFKSVEPIHFIDLKETNKLNVLPIL